MRKITAWLAAGVMAMHTLPAVAEDSLNNVRLSPQGVQLALMGQASLEIANDRATMLWSATEQAATLEEATTRLIERINRGTQTLRDLSADAVLQMRQVNTYPIYSETKGETAPRIIAWRTVQSISVQTDEIGLVAPMISALTGQLELDQLTFGVSEKTRDRHEKTLIAMAIDDATQRAVDAAVAMGLSAKNVRLTDLGFDGQGTSGTARVMMRSTGSSNDGLKRAVPNIEAGTSRLSISVKANMHIR